MSELLDAVEEEWCAALGCHRDLLRRPGVHLVPGGDSMAGYRHVYLARLEAAVLVYCPPELVERAGGVITGSSPDEIFTPAGASALGGGRTTGILGPSRHAFLDREHFHPTAHPMGLRLEPDDPGFALLREACGEEEWGEAGFGKRPGKDPVYGIRQGGILVAAGNMTPYRQRPADVGILTHPAHRDRGLARSLVSLMVAEALPTAGVVRYRALVANVASLSVAAALGFVPHGENLVARLAP